LQEGDAAAAAGRWNQARSLWRQLLTAPGIEEKRRFELRLRLVRAAAFLGDRDYVRDELASLGTHELADRYRGRIDFERAIESLHRAMEYSLAAPENLASDVNPFESEALIILWRVRDDATVPEADRATARGLMAHTAEEALKHYRAALDLQPFHAYAGPYYLVTSLIAGQLPQAVARAEAWSEAAPDDPLPWFYKAFALELQGKSADADAALARLAKAGGGGRALPLDTLRLCEGTVRAVRAINARLPESAAADDFVQGALAGVALVGDLKQALPDGVGSAGAVLFAVPLSPTQRREVGRTVTAANLVLQDPRQGLTYLGVEESFVADGMVQFVRGLLLVRAGRNDEAAAAMRRSAESKYHLWEVRSICWMCLVNHNLRLARESGDVATGADLRDEAKECLRRAASTAGSSAACVSKVRQLAKKFDDAEFAAEIERLLDAARRGSG
ncbi:MAG: hypothetical protein K2X91_07080, partial [Thermoleophilia bacterium]|nr:hypothetical protein [Thermoleophilia bacterium]